MKISSNIKNLFTLCNAVLDNKIKDKVLFIISVRSFISKIHHENKLDVTEINKKVAEMLDQAIVDDELVNL
jgi:type I restriction enzyme R subunit